MSIQTATVTAGTSVDIPIDPFDSSKKITEITITGRATGTVQIKIKSRYGNTFFAASGSSSIDLTSTDFLSIDGTAAIAVRIDDSANSGAALSVTIETA